MGGGAAGLAMSPKSQGKLGQLRLSRIARLGSHQFSPRDLASLN